MIGYGTKVESTYPLFFAEGVTRAFDFNELSSLSCRIPTQKIRHTAARASKVFRLHATDRSQCSTAEALEEA